MVPEDTGMDAHLPPNLKRPTELNHLIIFSQPSASPPTPSWLKYGTILLLLLYNIFAKQYFYSNNFLLMRVLEEYLGESSSTAL